jgi:hypothetical protein
MPAWRPDGGAVVAAAAPEEQTFNLVELPVDGSAQRQLTHLTGGALWPDVSPDGRTIVFAGYTTAGYDVFSIPYPRVNVDPARNNLHQPENRGANLPEPPTPDDRRSTLSAAPLAGPPPPSSTRYNPLATLAPTSWTPLISNDGVTTRLGGLVSGVDVLGYHSYSARASWLVSTTTDAPVPSRALPDWQVFYEYDRWRPGFFATASLETSFAVGPATPSGFASDSTLRETSLEAGVFYPIVHTRARHSGQASILRAQSDFTLPDGPLTRNRTAIRGSWQTITSRAYGYSISREDGMSAGATIEAVRRALGSDADATTYTADARAYLPGALPHHVFALRVSGGVSDGDPTVGRTFVLGGSTVNGAVDFSSRASSLLRGFPDATFAGTRVALANAEYRFPVYRLQRGFGTWPIFFHTFHAAVFGDAGDTWSDAFHASDLKTSFGVEASSDLVVAYFAPFTIAAGAALGHDRSGLVRDRATVYVRIGKSF